eukprot:m.167500 g.167500  ORF g.167500 m.167500 type:complete len:400 (+) comp16639_c0_seq2:113-1312(+)
MTSAQEFDQDVVVETEQTPYQGSVSSKRELFELFNGRIPLMPDNGLTTAVIKANKDQPPARRWLHQTFTNPARQDDFELQHWVAEDVAKDPYPFAKYNRGLALPTFTTAAYLRCLTTKNWTERETRLLFDLCRRFDRRFIIVHDRYMHQVASNSLTLKPRTVEDLKDRYYDCLAKLAADLKMPPNCMERSYRFDHEHETNRKQQLEAIYARTTEQVHEEDDLKAQLRQVRQRKIELGIRRDLAGLTAALATQAKKLKAKTKTSKQSPASSPALKVNKRESARKSVNNNSRVQVKRRSQNMFKPFKNVDPRIQRFIDGKLEALKLDQLLSTSKVSTGYGDIRNGLLALGNVTKSMHQIREEGLAAIQRRNLLLRQRNIDPPPLPAALASMTPRAKAPESK